jgi:hypothetical protein
MTPAILPDLVGMLESIESFGVAAAVVEAEPRFGCSGFESDYFGSGPGYFDSWGFVSELLRVKPVIPPSGSRRHFVLKTIAEPPLLPLPSMTLHLFLPLLFQSSLPFRRVW